jgi:hypothetical protein
VLLLWLYEVEKGDHVACMREQEIEMELLREYLLDFVTVRQLMLNGSCMLLIWSEDFPISPSTKTLLGPLCTQMLLLHCTKTG